MHVPGRPLVDSRSMTLDVSYQIEENIWFRGGDQILRYMTLYEMRRVRYSPLGHPGGHFAKLHIKTSYPIISEQ